MQALEGGIDSSHVSWLHSAGLNSDPLFKGSKGNQYNLNDMKPFFEVVDSRWRPATSACGATPRRGTTTGGSRRG